jgi:hypothetical protein
VATRVSKKDHKLNNKVLAVCLHHDVLGPSGGVSKRTFKVPGPVAVPEELKNKLFYVMYCPRMYNELESLLERYHAKLETNSQGPILACLLNKGVHDARSLASTWELNVLKALKQYLGDILVTDEPMTTEEYNEALPEITKLAETLQDVGILFNNTDKIAFVYKRAAHTTVEQIKGQLSGIKQRLHRSRNEKKGTIQLAPQEVELLVNAGAKEQISSRFPHLTLDVDTVSGSISMTGLEQEIGQAQQIIYAKCNNIFSKSHTFESPLEKKLLQSPKAQAAITEACQKEDHEGKVKVKGEGFAVWSLDREKARRMKEAGLNAVKKKNIPIGPGHSKAMGMLQLDTIITTAMARSNGALVVEKLTDSIAVIGTNSTFDDDVRKIEEFLEENYVQEQVFTLDVEDHDLFKAFMQKKGDIDIDTTSCIFNSYKSTITVTMSKEEVQKTEAWLQRFRDGIVTETRHFTEPSFSAFINSEKGKQKLKTIELAYKCKVIKLEDEAAMMMMPYGHAYPTQTPPHAGSMGKRPDFPASTASQPQSPPREFDHDTVQAEQGTK